MVTKPEVPIPDAPGAYLFKDEHGRVLYVGKAKSLRSRVSNYFTAGLAPRTQAMVDSAQSIDWIITGSDVEALMLEYSLIKEHRPRFNIRLRDDKSYPYLAIDLNEDWPRPRVTRGRKRKGVRYFGPYAHAYAIRETLDLLLRTFPARTCSDHKLARHERLSRPCLYFHIERCSGPCVGAVSKADYDQIVAELITFLDGDHAAVLDRLDKAMHAAAEELEFERAARLRDQLDSVKKASERQRAVVDSREDVDMIGIYGDELERAVQLFIVRGGRICGQRGFIVDNVEGHDDPDLLRDVLLEIYAGADEVPPRVEVPWAPSDEDDVAALLSERRVVLAASDVAEASAAPGTGGASRSAVDARLRSASLALTSGDPGTANYVPSVSRGGRVRIHVPRRGARRELLETVTENAEQSFRRHRMKRQADHSARAAALNELQEALDLPEAPLRIECFDVSQIQGSNPVASMVVFEDGAPRKSDYRRFKIKTVEGQDDFAMMAEALTRRFEAYLDERSDAARPHRRAADGGAAVGEDGDGNRATGDEVTGDTEAAASADAGTKRKRFGYPPQLLLIDGGRGQLNVALRVLEALGLEDEIAAAGLAKRFEELYLPAVADPILLPRGSQALYLVQSVRDEAHRFAITYHRQRRNKSMVASALDGIDGLGPVRRKKLLAEFGSVKKIREASSEELEQVPGVPAAVGRAVYDKLHSV